MFAAVKLFLRSLIFFLSIISSGTEKPIPVLITNADKCIFFTEGDFRSHLYLPPMMGKDVHVITSKDVWNLHSAPYQYWNKNVFKFGGKIIPHVLEENSTLKI